MTEQEYISSLYRAFIRKHGDLPVYTDENPPSAELWKENPNLQIKCYNLDNHNETLSWGFYVSPYCFYNYDKFSREEAIYAYKRNRYDTSAIDEGLLKAYQERQWAYFSAVDFENFQEDTININEGIIEFMEYYTDNTLKRRYLVDQQTGELLYEANYVQGQYKDPDSGKTRYYLKYMDRFQNGKYVAAERKKVLNKTRWVVTAPKKYSGQTLEDIYFKALKNSKYGKSTERPVKRAS